MSWIEEVTADVEMALDPSKFARALGIEPDPWQEELLGADELFILVLCSRQSGKSTTVAIKALHTAIYQAPALILIVAPAQRQSVEAFRKIKDFEKQVKNPIGKLAESLTAMELDNGSRIIALPSTEEKIRAFSAPALIIEDESSRVLDSTFIAMAPMLAISGGQHILLSTPNGKRGHFFHSYEALKAKEMNGRLITINAKDCPRITDEFLERQRAVMPPWDFRQEYMCEFVQDNEAYFDIDDVMAAVHSKRTINPIDEYDPIDTRVKPIWEVAVD